MIDPVKLRAIIETEIADLRSLAHLAGGHPATFYRGANFDNTDLRGEDLRGFNLEAATFKRAKVDEATLVDTPYKVVLRDQQEVLIGVFLPDAAVKSLTIPGNDYERQLGDALENMLAATLTQSNIHDPSASLDLLIDLFRLDNFDFSSVHIERSLHADFAADIKALDSHPIGFENGIIKATARNSYSESVGKRSYRLFSSYRKLQLALVQHSTQPARISVQRCSAESLNTFAAAAKTPLSNLCGALLLACAFK